MNIIWMDSPVQITTPREVLFEPHWLHCHQLCLQLPLIDAFRGRTVERICNSLNPHSAKVLPCYFKVRQYSVMVTVMTISLVLRTGYSGLIT